MNTYNETKHSSLGNVTPNEAGQENSYKLILNLNRTKSVYNKTVSDLTKGDTVRVLDIHLFKKGTEPKWSEETYKVVRTNGNTITINQDDNEVRYKRSKLLKVASD